jgi:MYXO-CTERM domain-containing protein
VRVALGVVLLSLVPSAALAQPAIAGDDASALQAEVETDYGQAMASDCALACKALGSMQRATQRLCALDPGDRCASAKQKLDAAAAHVHAACPDCAREQGERQLEQRPAESPPPPAQPVAEEATVTKRGGCAGCTVSPAGTDALAPAGLALLLGWVARRRRRR